MRGKGSVGDAGGCAEVPAAADGEEPPDEQTCAAWAQYYRECATYFEQQHAPQQLEQPAAPKAAVPAPQAAAPQQVTQLTQVLEQQQLEQLLVHQQMMQQAQALQQQAHALQQQVQAFSASPLLPAQSTRSPLLAGFGAQPSPSSFLGMSGWGAPFGARGAMGLGAAGGLPAPGGPLVGGLTGMDDDALVNLLTTWYLSGYYTGQYAARQGR